jgi:hypothetical protein
MLTTIDIPEALRNQKINMGMTWLGIIRLGLNNSSNTFKVNELETENNDLKERITKLSALLEKYVKLSKETN